MAAANDWSSISAILLDAGGVLIFPSPDLMLPPLRSAGVAPDIETLVRAHYWAMSRQDRPDQPAPASDTWWRVYLLDYVTACGVPTAKIDALTTEMSQTIRGFNWTHVPTPVRPGMRTLDGLGIPIGVVSNSDGTVEAALRTLGICHADPDHAGPDHADRDHAGPDHAGPNEEILAAAANSSKDPAASAPPVLTTVPGAPAAPAADQPDGVRIGVVVDSAVAGVAKPNPVIFGIALDALGISPGSAVIHVGDSLRYDVAGALAAGIYPVHMDPYGFCPAPDGHVHIGALTEIPALIGR